MLNKSFLLGCVCALGLAASPALAGDFSGTITGNYLNVEFPKYDVSGDAWRGSVELQGALGDSGIHGQIDGNYNTASIESLDLNATTFDASLFMPFDQGRVGATFGYEDFGGDASGHETNYGVFGEFWAADNVTLGAKVGGVSGEGDSAAYYGGEAVFYAIPDLALSGTITGVSDGGETEYTASAEYLVSEDVPVSVGGGYTYMDTGDSDLGHANIWFAKATFYFGDEAAKTLVDHHRTGNLGWAVGTGRLGLQF